MASPKKMTCVAVNHSLDELEANIVRCTACCPGDCRSYHCPLCPPDLFKPAKACKVKVHLKTHWKCRIPRRTADEEEEGERHQQDVYSVTCRLTHQNIEGTHFHCVHCERQIRRKNDAISHMKKCSKKSVINEEEQDLDHGESRDQTCQNSSPDVVLEDIDHDYSRPSDDKPSITKKVKCSHCGGLYSKKYIRQHERIHLVKQQSMQVRVCILQPKNLVERILLFM
ncbi:uncharacterized protein LOC135502487 [Lineus longissimus]|uniref:uncharacterized protein LOC135502487 n=1 Tax=Lineus longissimus TaxID=88925 RepID=UPI002B4F3B1C